MLFLFLFCHILTNFQALGALFPSYSDAISGQVKKFMARLQRHASKDSSNAGMIYQNGLLSFQRIIKVFILVF